MVDINQNMSYSVINLIWLIGQSGNGGYNNGIGDRNVLKAYKTREWRNFKNYGRKT